VRSKDGRNVEGLHAVGVLLIKDKCQLCVNSCAALIFMHFVSWVFPVYVACIFLFFILYESVHL
jgi:hypothetical protein